MTDIPRTWSYAPFGHLWINAQNGCGTRAGSGVATVVLRLADIDTEGRVASSGLREIALSEEERTKYALALGDILVFRVNGSPQITGRAIAYLGPPNFAFCDHFIRFRLDLRISVSSFVAQALSHGAARRAVERGMVSTAGQNTISQATLAEVVLPIPPPNEQNRIVEALDSYLSRLDAAVASLERVQAKLKAYRASVLKAAVEGRLVPTEAELARREGRDYEPAGVLLARILQERRRRWEEAELARLTRAGKSPKDNTWKAKYQEPEAPDTTHLPPLPEGWCWTSVDHVSEVKGGVTKGQQRRGAEVLVDVPYLRVANVQRGYLDLGEVKTISATAAEISELRLEPGDVLFNEGGDRDKLGRGWVWEGQLDTCIHQNHVFRARILTSDLSPKFLSWYGNSAGQRYFFDEGKQTTNLASINVTKLKGLPVPVPPIAEQARIAEEIERILSISDENEAAVAQNLARCGRLRQAVLKWAFEGKLVDQDPADEPAEQLLARIRAERASTAPTKKSRGRKAKTDQ